MINDYVVAAIQEFMNEMKKIYFDESQPWKIFDKQDFKQLKKTRIWSHDGYTIQQYEDGDAINQHFYKQCAEISYLFWRITSDQKGLQPEKACRELTNEKISILTEGAYYFLFENSRSSRRYAPLLAFRKVFHDAARHDISFNIFRSINIGTIYQTPGTEAQKIANAFKWYAEGGIKILMFGSSLNTRAHRAEAQALCDFLLANKDMSITQIKDYLEKKFAEIVIDGINKTTGNKEGINFSGNFVYYMRTVLTYLDSPMAQKQQLELSDTADFVSEDNESSSPSLYMSSL